MAKLNIVFDEEAGIVTSVAQQAAMAAFMRGERTWNELSIQDVRQGICNYIAYKNNMKQRLKERMDEVDRCINSSLENILELDEIAGAD